MKLDPAWVKRANNAAFVLVGCFLFFAFWHVIAQGTVWEPLVVLGFRAGDDGETEGSVRFPKYPVMTPIDANEIPEIFKEQAPVLPTPVASPTRGPGVPTKPVVSPTEVTERDRLQAIIVRGNTLFDNERFAEAEKLYKDVVNERKELGARFAEKYYRKGLRYAERKDWGTAASLYKMALHFRFEDFRIHEAMVKACTALKDFKRVNYHKGKAKAFRNRRPR